MIEVEEQRPQSPRRRLRQLGAASAASLGGLVAGMALAFEMEGLTLLLDEEDETYTPLERMALILSVVLGAVVGAVFSGVLAHFCGRKPAMILIAMSFIASCLLLFLCITVNCLYAARGCAGFGVGGVFTVVPIYVSEVATDRARASMGSLLEMMFNTGILLSFVATVTEHFWKLNLFCLLISAVFLAGAAWMPETAQFLRSRGRIEEANSSLYWLRGETSGWPEDSPTEKSPAKDIKWRMLLSDRATRKSLEIAVGLVILQQLTEIRDEAFEETTVLEEAGLSLPSFVASMTFEWASLVTSLAAIFIVDRAERKVLLLVSGLGMATSLAVMGLYTFLQDVLLLDLGIVSWLPLMCALFYTVFYNIGLGPLPWVLMGELLPPGAKSLTGSLVSSLSAIFTPLAPGIYNTLLLNFGAYTSYAFFTIICTMTAMYALYVVPETMGKTLSQIQSELSGQEQTRL